MGKQGGKRCLKSKKNDILYGYDAFFCFRKQELPWKLLYQRVLEKCFLDTKKYKGLKKQA
jgi:hypothetical protein